MHVQQTEEKYSNLVIRIVPQPKNGDHTKVFFRILSENISSFVYWLQISDNQSQNRSLDETYNYLINEGLKDIKSIIDKQEYIKGDNFQNTLGAD